MTFSVIIPTYNRCERLHKAAASVLAQTHTDLELIIVDDGSTDRTRECLEAVADPRLRYYFQENRGPAAARNTGIAQARADWIAFLDSDDWWLPQKLERAAAVIRRFPEISVFHTEERWFRRGALLRQKPKYAKPDGWVYIQALPLCCISISTAVLRREILREAGGFDESFPACEDYDLWLRITHRHPVKLIPECLTEKDGGRPDELSVRTWGLDRFRIRALQKMLESGVCGPEASARTAAELERKCLIFARGAAKRGRPQEARRYRELASVYSKRLGGAEGVGTEIENERMVQDYCAEAG